MAIKDGKGRDVITMNDPPKFRKGGLSEKIITTGNIDEILLRKKAEEERAAEGVELKQEDEHADKR